MGRGEDSVGTALLLIGMYPFSLVVRRLGQSVCELPVVGVVMFIREGVVQCA